MQNGNKEIIFMSNHMPKGKITYCGDDTINVSEKREFIMMPLWS